MLFRSISRVLSAAAFAADCGAFQPRMLRRLEPARSNRPTICGHRRLGPPRRESGALVVNSACSWLPFLNSINELVRGGRESLSEALASPGAGVPGVKGAQAFQVRQRPRARGLIEDHGVLRVLRECRPERQAPAVRAPGPFDLPNQGLLASKQPLPNAAMIGTGTCAGLSW